MGRYSRASVSLLPTDEYADTPLKTSARLVFGLAMSGVVVGVVVGVFRGMSLGVDYLAVAILKGVTLGSLLAVAVGGLEQVLLRQLWRRLSLARAILVRTVLYTLVALGVFLAVSVAFHPWVPWRLQREMIVPSLGITAALFLIGSAFFAGTRLLGFRVVRNLLSGRYHRPFEEDRIFLFLDLVGSTTLAERIGSLRYHSFLSDFIADLERPVFEHGGDIYQYIGDEVVVTWRVADRRANSRCLSCYLAILEQFDQTRGDYEARFGASPRFRVGIHCGRVVAGEIGGERKQIVFVGDVVNTASRMEAEARARDLGAVASGALLSQIELPAGIEVHPLGFARPRGKEMALELFEIAQRHRHKGHRSGESVNSAAQA